MEIAATPQSSSLASTQSSVSSQLLTGAQEAMNLVTQDAHDQMLTTLKASLTTGATQKLSFEGIRVGEDENGDIEINVGVWGIDSMPLDARLGELRKQIAENQLALEKLLNQLRPIIELAGDIPEAVAIILYRAIRALLVLDALIPDEKSPDPQFARYEELAEQHGFKLKINHHPRGVDQPAGGVAGFEMTLEKPTIEEIELKIEVMWLERLQDIYKERFKVIISEGTMYQLSTHPHPLGMPMLIKTESSLRLGFYKKTENGYVIEQLQVKYLDGCVFTGKCVNGCDIGEGSFRINDEAVFHGAVLDERNLVGEIVSGIIRRKGKFARTTSGNEQHYIQVGEGEVYVNTTLARKGVFYEDGSFKGVRYSDSQTITGAWDKDYNREGRFEFVNSDFKFECAYVKGKLSGQVKLTFGTSIYEGTWGDGMAFGTLTSGDEWYQGPFRDMKYHGKGKRKVEDRVYEGDFQYGSFTGQGVLTIGTSTWRGSFLENKPHGRCVYVNGATRYEGDYVHWKRHGNGHLTAPGLDYNGAYVNGEYHGHGTLKLEDWTYTGGFVKGKKHGNGHQTAPGLDYNGAFENDDYHGYGTLKFKDCTYTGEFVKGKFHGNGHLTAPGLDYNGAFENDKYHGHGTLKLGDYTYTGGFVKGKKHGNGHQTALGLDYNGAFENDDYHGYGTLKFKDCTCTGEFVKGKQEGAAKVTIGGRTHNCNYKNGVLLK